VELGGRDRLPYESPETGWSAVGRVARGTTPIDEMSDRVALGRCPLSHVESSSAGSWELEGPARPAPPGCRSSFGDFQWSTAVEESFCSDPVIMGGLLEIFARHPDKLPLAGTLT
jgi:hypothetical protein